MDSYEIDLTVAPELNRLDTQMRPFGKRLPSGRPTFAVLAIDVDIKHLSLMYLNEPLPKNTAVHHGDGLVLISLPRDLGGYHAKNVLLGQRGINALSFIASNADVSGNAVCVSSPSQFQLALEEVVACLNDAASLEAQDIPAEELLMKELRLKAVSQDGKNITRFEQLIKHDQARLIDADLGIPVDCEEALNLAIAHRVKKACAMGVNIQNLEGRLRDIFMFCTEGVKLDIDREIERAMPGAVPYRTFAEALGYVCESFTAPESPGVETLVAATDALILGGDDFVFVEPSDAAGNNSATRDLFDAHEHAEPILGAPIRHLVLGVSKLAVIVKAAIDCAKGLRLEDVVQVAQKGKALAKRLGHLASITSSHNAVNQWISAKRSAPAHLITIKPKGVGLVSPVLMQARAPQRQFDSPIGVF